MDFQALCKTPFFLFCGYSKKDDLGDKIQKITALGGWYENTKKFSANCSHVICKKPVQNEIFLSACLTGKWILIPKYIQDCFEQCCWLTEQPYEWESKFITDCSSSYEMKLHNAPKQHKMLGAQNGYRMFKGWKIVLIIDNKMKSSKYSRLLALGEAEVVSPDRISEPCVVTTLTHVFFEGIDFEPLNLLGDKVPILRPEYIDSCIVEVSFPSVQLFQVTLPNSSFLPRVIRCPINDRISSANMSSDYTGWHSPGSSRILAMADSVNSGTEKIDSINNEERRMSTENLQVYQPESICLPFVSAVSSSRDSETDVTCHVDKRFKPNVVRISASKEKCVTGDGITTEISCSSITYTVSMFSEGEAEMCEQNEVDAVPIVASESSIVTGFLGMPLNAGSGNSSSSSFATDDHKSHDCSEESCTSLNKFISLKKDVKSNSDIDIARFNKTLKFGNERTKSKRMVSDKSQSLITSFFVDAQRECCTELRLNDTQYNDAENSSISSKCQPDIFLDGYASCNNNSDLESMNQIGMEKEESRKLESCKKDTTKKKCQPDIFLDGYASCSSNSHLESMNQIGMEKEESRKLESCKKDTMKNKCQPDILLDGYASCSSNSHLESMNQIGMEKEESKKLESCKDTMKKKIDCHQRCCNVTSSMKVDKSSKCSGEGLPPGGYDDLLDVGFEEEDLLNVLDTAESLICPSYQPHPRLLNSLMFRVLECSFDENISSKTFIILHRIFHLHRPGNDKLGQYYLDAFSLCGKERVPPWFVLAEIIRKCVEHKASHSAYSRGAEYLLSFIVDVIEYNFKDFKFRNKFPRKLLLEKKGLLPIAAIIFWPTDSKCSGAMNRECKELFHYIYKLLDCSIKPKHMFEVLLLLQKLLGIVAECSIFFDPGTHSNVYNRSSAHSVVAALMSAVQDPLRNNNDLLHLFLDTMQCVWLRLLFCQKFIDHCTLSYFATTDNNCLTLGKIVKSYMQKTPPKYKYRLRNHSSKIKKPRQPPDKILKCDASKHQKSSECHSDINKRNNKGETKLHIACKAGKDDDVRKLLDVDGIDVNIQDNAGWTPLHEACEKGHIKCVQLLLEWSPPDNSNGKVKLMPQSMEGITPLHDAVRFNHIEVADLLLKHGGRRLVERCTKLGYTPCDLARSKAMEQLLTVQYPYIALTEEQEVIEISSDSDIEEDDPSNVNVYQYLFLIYHMLVSYLTVYRVDEMVEELKKLLKEESGMIQFENKSFGNASPQSCNMQMISKAVSNVLSSNLSTYAPEVSARQNDLRSALAISDAIDELLVRMSKISLENNSKTICTALEMLSLKYRL